MAEELKLDKALSKIEYTFRWTGMILESSRKTRKENSKYKYIYFFNFLLFNSDIAGAIAWFIDNARKGASITTLTYVAPCITFCFLANAKSISIMIYEKHINQILSILRNLEINYNNGEKILEKEEICKKETKFLFFVLKWMNFFNWSLMIAFPLMPLSLTALEYYNTKRIELKLPFFVLYPFDAYDIKYWPWVYLRHFWETVVVIFETSGVDYLFYVCVTFICMGFNLVKYDMQNFISGNEDTTLEATIIKFRLKLVHILKQHQELISAVQLLEVIYAKSLLINFVSSSLLICLSGFNISTIDDKPFIISFVSFLFASLLQILTICYFGDMLMKSSTEISNAIFESKWYIITNGKLKKEILIINLRAQKPCKLTAYGFADVNLNAFTRILSTSWSYFALLRTVYSSPRA